MRRARGSRVRLIGLLTLVVGVLLTAGVGGGWWWTNHQARSTAHGLADRATQAFTSPIEHGPRTAVIPKGVSGPVVAVVKIPKLGVDWRMPVERGTGTEILRQGLGMYDSSPAVGKRGNVGIAGHRTTWGAPFKEINTLARGDLIQVWTTQGRFDYKVTDTGITVPADVSVIQQKTARGQAMLTLTTCHPEFSATERLYVHAVLADSLPAPAKARSAPA
ncbi:sortase [Kineosporia babensis]|uniref:Sortase n=1 Tax=Kineosporia babensis TaxID=499548 RepID=A0A9X1SRP6_9ACTN|nr:sortase [Kineosporia babensis]MCD5309852.1 sortase [Kineosporia babensis]